MRVKSKGTLPVYASEGAVGADLIVETISYNKEWGLLIYDTGLAIELPAGYEAQVRARSSLVNSAWYMPHGVGTIDQDFRGTIKVVLAPRQWDRNIYDIKPPYAIGERCAQLVIAPVTRADFVTEDLDETERGDKGFGSTGKTTTKRKASK